METPSIATEEVPRHWREEGPPGKPITRNRKRFLAAALFLTLAAVFAVMLSWIAAPPNPTFVPLWITEYQDRRIPFPAMGDRDREAFREGRYFTTRGAEGSGGQESHHIRKLLEQLRKSPGGEVVVVISGHARRSADGKLYVLPADALPEDPNTWLSFREILELLQSCPASHKLLIVDLMRPWINPHLGVLTNDAAEAVAAELKLVDDPNRLVLCACSPGQVSLNSEAMGQSVFAFYLEEGLRGYADGYGNAGRRNGVVTATELAAFTAARVDRWSRQNRNQRQTPVLYGDADDFPLTALPYQKPRPHLTPAPKREYPQWLVESWTEYESWWQTQSYRFAPRVFRMQEQLMEQGEQYWRGYIPQSRIQENIIARIKRLAPTFAKRTQQAQFHPTSLAQVAYLGLEPDAKTAKAVNDALTKFFKEYDKAAAAAKGVLPLPAKEKLVAEFQAETKAYSASALGRAAFQYALADVKHKQTTIELLDELLRTPNQPQPQFVETLLLRHLSLWGAQVKPAAWTPSRIDQILNVIQTSEKCLANPNGFLWLEQLIEKLQQSRHEGEMRMWARGFVSLADADSVLQSTRALSAGVLGQTGSIELAISKMNMAFSLLPMMTVYVDATSDRQELWERTLAAAVDLYTQLQPQTSTKMPLDERIDAVAKRTVILCDRLGDLSDAFAEAQVTQLLARAAQPTANADVYVALDALLAVPHPWLTAKQRKEVWTALQKLGRRLHESTIQLDHDEDAAKIQTIAPDRVDTSILVNAERRSAFARLKNSLALLDWAGVPKSATKKIADTIGTPDASIADLGVKLHTLWARTFRETFQEQKSPEAQTRMSWFVPPLATLVELDQAATAPAMLWHLHKLRRQWRWLSDWYSYLSRDYLGAGKNLISGKVASDFYQLMSNINADLAASRPQPYLAASQFDPIKPLDAKTPAAAMVVQMKRFNPTGKFATPNVNILVDETGWLKLRPSELGPVQPGVTPSFASQTLTIPVSLSPSAKKSTTPPKGLFITATAMNRSFHILAPVPIQSASQDVKIIVSPTQAKPTPAVDEIRLRPGGVVQTFYVFLQNPSADVRNVMAAIGGVQVKATLQPNSTQQLKLPAGKALKEGEPLPALVAPLTIQVSDAKSGDVIDSRVVPVRISSPREYVGVTNIQYSPGGLPPGNNKLSVTLQSLMPMPGAGVPVVLSLPANRIPSLRTIGGGTFSGVLSTQKNAPPLTLFAVKMKLVPAASNRGFVYIAVDGVPRTFIYRTLFTMTGDPLTPRGDVQPGLRLTVPAFVKAETVFMIPVEVDNASPDASLEVAIGLQQAGGFQADFVRTYPQAKNRRIGFAPSSDGGLSFDAAIKDWAVAVDTSRIQGKRTVRARLLDRFGNPIMTTTQSIMVDGTSPNIVRFVDPPTQVKKGTVVTLNALADDAESGIAKVAFFVGRPKDNQPPPKTAMAVAKPLVDDASTWTAQMQLPDQIGTTAISVQATNNVGLSRITTVELNLTETDLAKTGPGRITGIVTEGRLPQAGLEVILYEKGKVKAKTKTKKDGSYEFADLKPGKYGVYCFKPSSRRRAMVVVTVAPNQTAKVPLDLAI